LEHLYNVTHAATASDESRATSIGTKVASSAICEVEHSADAVIIEKILAARFLFACFATSVSAILVAKRLSCSIITFLTLMFRVKTVRHRLLGCG
jgi:hypothetical protein